MIILDKPFASQELKEYLQTFATPVLENDFAREIKKDYELNLKNEKEFRKLLIKNKNLLTISENSLKWIYENLEDEAKISGIETMKNKAVVRKLLAGGLEEAKVLANGLPASPGAATGAVYFTEIGRAHV